MLSYLGKTKRISNNREGLVPLFRKILDRELSLVRSWRGCDGHQYGDEKVNCKQAICGSTPRFCIQTAMKVEVNNNAVEISTTIPLMRSAEVLHSNALDVIGAFSSYLIVLLKRRGEACMKLLRSHINDVFFNDGFTIAWHRKDGTVGYFCIPGYENIQCAIRILEDGQYEEFLKNPQAVDQAIKAIMNDPELDHSDAGSFKFSELVSILCEAHMQLFQRV